MTLRSTLLFESELAGGEVLVTPEEEDQRFFTVRRRDDECISKLGTVSILMWYATRLMENPVLEAEKVALIIAEAIAAEFIAGELGFESFAEFLIANMGIFVKAGLMASYMDFKDDWTQKVTFCLCCVHFTPKFIFFQFERGS